MIQQPQYKALIPLAMLFITLALLTLTIGYQVVEINGRIFSAVALIIPFRYLLCDVISEVYGYITAKKFIWWMLACSFLFSFVISNIIELPSPSYWTHYQAYKFVLGGSFKIALCASLGLLAGSFINIYLVSKWKVLVRGKLFWLRSLGGSIIGELTQYVIGLTLMFSGHLEWMKIVELIVADYLLQAAILALLAPLAHIAMYYLKKYEDIDSISQNVAFEKLSRINF